LRQTLPAGRTDSIPTTPIHWRRGSDSKIDDCWCDWDENELRDSLARTNSDGISYRMCTDKKFTLPLGI
jgi:hypothetical protein